MHRLTLHLGGPFRAALDEAPLEGLSRRAQGLLAYLACQPGMRVERGALADLLWSDRSEAQARGSLRQELSVLRKKLGDLLEGDRNAVWLQPGSVQALHEGGAFLRGFDLPSEGFEEWLRDMRAAEEPSRFRPTTLERPNRDRPSLAVLPFGQPGQAEDDVFADGIVEEITGALSRVHDFHVIARQSAFALRGEWIGVPEAAAHLGADYIVEGTVRRSGDRVRISVELVSGQDGRMIWSERFDDRIDDLFDLQDRIAAHVAGQISPNLRAAEIARARTHPPADRTAYELVLTAMPHFWAHRRDTNAEAIRLLEQAVEQSPDYGPALSYLAWAVAQQPTYIWSSHPEADRKRAISLADRAALITTDHAPSLVAIGAAYSLSHGHISSEKAGAFLNKALQIDPNNAWGWMRIGWHYFYSADFERAMSAFDRAEILSPLDPFGFNISMGRAGVLRTQGDFDGAITWVRKAMLQSPGTNWMNRVLAPCLYKVGRIEEARHAMSDLMAAYPGLTLEWLRQSMPPQVRGTTRDQYDILLDLGLPRE